MVNFKINLNIKDKHIYLIFGLLILFGGMFVVNAFGGDNPSVMGHSAGEVDSGVSRVYNRVYVGNTATPVAVSVTCPTGKTVVSCGFSRDAFSNYPNYDGGVFWHTSMIQEPALDGYSWWFLTKREGLDKCTGEFKANLPGYYNIYYYIEATCI